MNFILIPILMYVSYISINSWSRPYDRTKTKQREASTAGKTTREVWRHGSFAQYQVSRRTVERWPRNTRHRSRYVRGRSWVHLVTTVHSYISWWQSMHSCRSWLQISALVPTSEHQYHLWPPISGFDLRMLIRPVLYILVYRCGNYKRYHCSNGTSNVCMSRRPRALSGSDDDMNM